MRLEPKSYSERGLRAMCHPVQIIQRRQVESRTVVYQAAILGAQEKLARDVEVRADAVDERGPCLRVARGILRIEYQPADSGQSKRRQPARRVAKHISRGHFIRMRLHSQ